MRCLEIEPAWRYPTAAQLVFDLSHSSQVKLTKRSERLKRDPLTTVLRRRFNKDLVRSIKLPPTATHISSAPIVAVAIDLADAPTPLNDALLVTAERILATLPSARLACLNVLKVGRITIDTTVDQHGHNKRIDRIVALKHWAEPLNLGNDRLTAHVLEADGSGECHPRIRPGEPCRSCSDRRAAELAAAKFARKRFRQGSRRSSVHGLRRAAGS